MSTSSASQRSWVDDEPRRYTVQSPILGMSASSRPTSPSIPSARSFRPFSPNADHYGNRSGAFSDIFMGGRLRASSSTAAQPRNTGKGKEKEPTESMDSNSTGYDPDPFVAPYGASPYVNFETVRDIRTEVPPHFPKRHRQSILGAASDALNFKFGRRRKSLRQPPQPMILSEVIEISASRRDEEDEERERLRDAAALSIGLGPELVGKSHQREESLDEEDEDDGRLPDDERTVDRHTTGGRSTHGSTLSVSMSMSSGPLQPPLVGRRRAGSLALSTQSRINSSSTPGPSVPPFPSTVSSLSPFEQLSTTLPKYYPPPSLLMLALSKQWRNRFVILTSPPSRQTRMNGAPPVSYLHLFKSPEANERELERLEVNEDSVVFIADEEVSGRGSVVKVGGIDVGAMRRELNAEENGQTMWLLQILDSTESQNWIAAIKAAILAQRSLRKGLGIPSHSMSGAEPRGDMDVMLSMRAQGLLPSPVQSEFPASPPRSPPAAMTGVLNASDANGTITTSPHGSLRGYPTPKSTQANAVSALKGLFTSRPRSPSRATSIDSERDTTEESFSSMGNNLLSLLRSNGNAQESMKSPVSSPKLLPISTPRVPPGPILTPLERNLQRKIMQGREPLDWSFSDVGKENQSKRSSAGSPSLQPPPRKRLWTLSSTASSSQEQATSLYNNVNASMSFGVGQSSEAALRPPGSPSVSVFSAGSATPEQKPRAPSLSSVSTFNSSEGLERSNSNVKRWTRQGVLPKRLTPPSGPPPAPPTSPDSQRSKAQTLHPYAAERPPSQGSSIYSPSSPQSFLSAMPTFSKRASSSSGHSISIYSNSTTSTSAINIPSRPMPSGRMSLPPPPRPAPNTALPPTPAEESQGRPGSAPANKTSFRESFTHRALRLSLAPPRDPPSSGLPPRPDDPSYRSHRRSSSSGNNCGLPRSLYPIPGSPIPPGPPHPPPTGPLPPPPVSPSSLSRLPSIKQRIRMLSAPTAPSPLSSPPTTPVVAIHGPATPSTPIGEPITKYQNDPDFLLSSGDDDTPKDAIISAPAPISSGPAPLSDEPPAPESSPNLAEITSLSPPPRRASRPIPTPDRQNDSLEPALPENSLASSGHVVSGSFTESLSPPPPPRRSSEEVVTPDSDDGHDEGQDWTPEDSSLTLLKHHDSTVSLGIVSI
ncbi:hypothetical protein NEOLEDRAFT_1130925 [Neolentinus lepideus HHB14362 ss-1]|uniref:PH domain-containing protein n=1 Tax=Neolentinus lepideus HHB14362 ss-1 TaxID=1314782 RepID=A0A165TZ11_9AGAM|nr:hypothetical protein NEOLEDRAFT_1130925 [Neolentinus lepideus HHB14362 ss-1]